MVSVNLIQKVIDEDINIDDSSEKIWSLSSNKPEIRQIYGHFLSPLHRNAVENDKGLVAIDFNFPSTYSAQNVKDFQNIWSGDISGGERMRHNKSVRIRPQKGGAVIYTSHYNGFFVNEAGYDLVKHFSSKISLAELCEQSTCEKAAIMNFVARLLALGIIYAEASRS